MRIKTIKNQHRRDFVADFECEHCGHTVERPGYDDHNYHHNVVPSMACPSCERTAGDEYRPLETRYDEDTQV